MSTLNKDNYWKSEYENLRRKYNKEKESRDIKVSKFAKKTFDLLKLIGLTDKEIFEYYAKF